jgi:hypothetical protein
MSKDPLASWSDRPAKASILAFVNRVTKKGAVDFVSVAERIAVFDNDGTLWPELPTVIQFAFAFDRVRALLPEHPEWETTHPFRPVLEGEEAKVSSKANGMTEIIAATHSGMTTTDFDKLVMTWLESANHPRFEVRYTDLIYQPMVELLEAGIGRFDSGIRQLRQTFRHPLCVQNFPADPIHGDRIGRATEVRSDDVASRVPSRSGG